MNMRICPFCCEKIHYLAVVCRYCQRDLPELQQKNSSSIGWLFAITATAIIVSGTAFLASEFIKERRNWLEE